MDAHELLQRHLPVLRFDSLEQFFPVSARAWTDCPGHVLQRIDGTVLAQRSEPTASTPRLQLSLLAPGRYRDGASVRPGDAIASPGRGYLAKAARFHHDPAYADRVYGRARAGSDGRTWLQYYWFYFFNDYRLLMRRLAAGVHEGDWEMIQLRLDAAGCAPDLALYTHHRSARTRTWDITEKVGPRPVIYVARGSHGCHFTAGIHWTGAWFDHADGRIDRGPQTLEVVDDGPAYDWIRWPGAWGGTRLRHGPLAKADGQSPAGPGAHFHVRWRDPAILLERAR